MDVLKHIEELMADRGWNLNQLAKISSVPQSTLSGLYQRNNSPTIPTLEKLCDAFGLTMSEFFSPDGKMTVLTDEQRELLDKWNVLPDNQKEAVWALLNKL